MEKQKRKKTKRLNLLGEEDSGPQLFSPSRVQAAKAFQAQKEAVEEEKKTAVAEKKAQAVANKLQKEKDKQEKALRRAIQRQQTQAVKEQKKAEIQARKATREAAKKLEEQTRLERINSKKPKKACNFQSAQKSSPEHSDSPDSVEAPERSTRSGRVVKPPRKL